MAYVTATHILITPHSPWAACGINTGTEEGERERGRERGRERENGVVEAERGCKNRIT